MTDSDKQGVVVPRPARLWLRAVFGALLLGAVFLGSSLSTCAYRALSPKLPAAFRSKTELRDSKAVVTAIRDLAVLESASYHMERVIDLREKQTHMFGLFESQDALLLVAAADVVAGIDLSSMNDGDIRFDAVGHSAKVVLPPATVLSARLDNDNTYVHSRSTDPLARRTTGLETRARQEAERTLREAAIDAGILLRAQKNSAVTIETLLKSLGFVRIEITFRRE
jgi:hypothetical protein